MKYSNETVKYIQGIFFIVLAALCWSCGGVFLKSVKTDVMVTASIRCWIGFFAMMLLTRSKPLLYVKEKYEEKENYYINRRETLYLWLGSLSYAATSLLFVFSNRLTTAANAILLEYTNPLWIIVFSPYLLGEKTNKSDYITIIGVIFGMILFFADELIAGFKYMNKTAMLGNFIAVLSGISMAFSTMFLRKQRTASNSIKSYMNSQLLVALVGTPFIFIHGLPDKHSFIFLILTGVIVGALPGIFYPLGLKKIAALTASLIAMLEPLMSPVWVMIFTGETPSLLCITGGFIILIFVVFRLIYKNKKNIMI
ncbi:MAG: DMT family transporter [Treponema sp.]|nr:DMT family transporter [Treponema sp.]